MKNYSRCREKMEDRVGRYRTYRCRICGKEFQQFRLISLPEKKRVCPECRGGE
jgi:DNA-directed RNA polymerase subunit RPC12/RpoP